MRAGKLRELEVFDRSQRNGGQACAQLELGAACRDSRRFALPPFFVSVASKGFSSSVRGQISGGVGERNELQACAQVEALGRPGKRRYSFTPPLLFVSVASKGFSSLVGGAKSVSWLAR